MKKNMKIKYENKTYEKNMKKKREKKKKKKKKLSTELCDIRYLGLWAYVRQVSP